MTTLDDRPTDVADPLAGPEALNVPGLDPSTVRPGAALAVRKTMTMNEKVHWADQLARSDLLPKDFRGKPANILWALEYAEALRLPNIAAITGVHVMDGKPTPSAALMSALVRRAGHRCRIGYTPNTDGPGGMGIGWCEIVRKDDPGFTYRAEWSVTDAVTAQLCAIKDGKPYSRSQNGKPQNWEKYTRNMLKWRALSECARDACEEALMGMHYLADELGADTDEDGVPVFIEGEVVHRDDVATKLVGDPDQPEEPDWDARIAEHAAANDADKLVALYKWAQHLRPNDTVLQERIAREGAQARRRAEAAAETAQGGVQGPKGGQPGTETPPGDGSAASGATSGPDDTTPGPGTEYPDGTVAADVVGPTAAAAADAVEPQGVPEAPADPDDDGYQLPEPPPYARHSQELARQPRHKAIMVLVTKVQGMARIDDATRHALLTALLRREVTTQSAVTAEEAAWLIQILVKAEKAGELGVLIYTALGRELPADVTEGLPDPNTEEPAWHEAGHPVWRRAQLDVVRTAEDCSVCTARRNAQE